MSLFRLFSAIDHYECAPGRKLFVTAAGQPVTPAEVLRPLAPVVFGGIASDTALTLVASLALDRLLEGEDNPDC